MRTFNLKSLIKINNAFVEGHPSISTESSQASWDIDIRTVRFYQTVKAISLPDLIGRENIYSSLHLKEIIAVKLLQESGLTLRQISSRMGDVDTIIRKYGVKYLISPEEISSFVESHSEEPVQDSIRDETAAASPESTNQAGAAIGEEQLNMSLTTSIANQRNVAGGPMSIDIKDSEYSTIRDNVKVGHSFLFLSGLSQDLSVRINKILNGQRTKRKPTENVVVPIGEDECSLPGFTAKKKAMSRDLLVLVSDKDVYREMDDIAQIAVIDPSAPSQQVYLEMSIDGVKLDTLIVKLDRNGCGMTRYATVASGKYTAKAVDHETSISFEATRYSLAPMTAIVGSSKKNGKKIAADLVATSFGTAFSGSADVAIVCDGQPTGREFNVDFKNGCGQIEFSTEGIDGAIGLRVTAKNDPELIAYAPLSGSRKAEREDTEISSLGKVRSVCLMKSDGSSEERGLHFDESGSSNSPVRLKSCISKKIDLEFIADVEQVNVVVCEPTTGETRTIELGSKEKGDKESLDLDTTLASVHIGCFLNNEPWEGHAVVVKPAENRLSMAAPSGLAPGDVMRLKVKATGKSSVFVKVTDKRMRVQDDYKTGLASMLKRWISSAIAGAKTGIVNVAAPPIVMPNMVTLAGVFGATGPQGPHGPIGTYGPTGHGGWNTSIGGQRHPNRRGMVPGNDVRYGASLSARSLRSNENDSFLMASTNDASVESNVTHTSFFNAANFATGDILTGGPISIKGTQEVEFSNASLAAIVADAIAPREMDVDLVYSGLVEVDGERELAIKLPDCIGLYDVSAVAICGPDWFEAKLDLVVSKDAYLEPMIPQYAHPEDDVLATVVGVGTGKKTSYEVTINGDPVEFSVSKNGGLDRLSYKAMPGVHEVAMLTDGAEVDRIRKVVECPGEEAVLGQETRILKVGDEYDISSDEDALSIAVVPGLENELKTAIGVCSDFAHSCCEQTSAKIVAACLAALIGTEDSKEKAYQAIVKGEARMKSMFLKGKGFASYPGQAVSVCWSAGAARRLARLDSMLSAGIPSDAKKAIDSMTEMGKDAIKAHGKESFAQEGPAEAAYFGKSKVSNEQIKAALAVNEKSSWDYAAQAEAAYTAAALLRDGNLESGIDVANAVSKVIARCLGGGMHGTCETLAYLHMIKELNAAGVTGTGKGKVSVDGKKMSILDAVKERNASSVKATDGVVAVKIVRLMRIKFDETNCGVQLHIDVVPRNGGRKISVGDRVLLKAKIKSGYKDGDVLCVALPECLSRIVGGTKTKKFQLDFAGKDSIEVELVASSKTKRQRWAGIVRNMYDGSRIGSVGLLEASIN